MSDKLVLVGCGNMGFAMLKGWLDAGILTPEQVTVVEPNDALRKRAATLGVNGLANASRIEDDLSPRIILIAVKPQVIRDVLPAYERFASDATFVSVVAGVKVALFEQFLGETAAIIRTIPNTPAAIGKGMIVTFRNMNVGDEDAEFVDVLLKTSGKVAAVDDEKLIDVATAVSGSGPAYVFHFIECLTEAAVVAGLERKTAEMLAMQTVYGAGVLAASSEDTPTKLREQVTSPKGTTAAALDVLMGHDKLKRLMIRAVFKAHQRAIELGTH
ncbi:pyrroline-5-carboxylate reductase [Phyllobacterium endophyticum]|uniref:Pyrroline-5-carboxylate reductase n=1 Tax=Phyllobacterium endophyticum TaxID=1149773 RepID=A0A2P7B102_9HYPH|nr:pyrroline-5-carboxylate reductase [Phyllobacterium endophyticum]MBB3237690.1 pyrroline-5-carboxylate reductase [Phyllobacterium endophyticum]PSH60149.1 pyrroline-5-carboxylate reductase [Phyllobacterium endophyticum]TYR42315.1 pyrroline-5-carboxylate reductase [Phyllobacterium endophyticum]